MKNILNYVIMNKYIEISHKIISIGDQNIDQKIIENSFGKYNLKRKKIFLNILNNYLFDIPFYRYLDHYNNMYIKDMKLFKQNEKYILYILLSYNSQNVKEIDNNILVPEYKFNYQYLCISCGRINDITEINNVTYDNNSFDLILYFNSPNIYEFDENIDFKILEYNNKNEKVIVFKVKKSISFFDLYKIKISCSSYVEFHKSISIKDNVLIFE